MRVRLLVQLTGTRDGVEWPERGAEVDLPNGEAAEMVAAGLAEAVAPTREAATAAPAEDAAAPRARRRKAT